MTAKLQIKREQCKNIEQNFVIVEIMTTFASNNFKPQAT
jgi:hypothetical protein